MNRTSANTPRQVSGTLCACGDHYFAPLSRGYVTLVSPEDAELLRRKWSASVGPRAVQVTRHDGPTTILLSRAIMKPEPGFVVDHVNCDPSDNRRGNLRICSQSENSRNRRKERGASLPYKGVYFARGRYFASITQNGKRRYLGGYATAEEAHAAYCAAAERLHGEFARLG